MSETQAAVAFAEQQVGKPYQWGKTGPNAYDCSGLVYAAYSHAGVRVGRTTYQQVRDGKPVSRKNLKPGDLVFPTPSYDHVQIYLGDGKIVEAARPGVGVRNSVITTFYTGRRVASDGGNGNPQQNPKPSGSNTKSNPVPKGSTGKAGKGGTGGGSVPISKSGGMGTGSGGIDTSNLSGILSNPWAVALAIVALGWILNRTVG